MTYSSVLVYNQGGSEVLSRVTVQHAVHMIHKGVAVIKQAIDGETFGPYPLPQAVELVRYVFAEWKYKTTGRVPFKKIGVLRRDNFTCAYCGVKGQSKVTTVDHVLPKWQKNALTWNNAVAACSSCNLKKGGRTPDEAGMKLKYAKPFTPLFQDAYAFVHGKRR